MRFTQNPILRANANLPVPAWVHDLALAKSENVSWAGRNDCPTRVAQGLIENEVRTYETSEYSYYRNQRFLKLATLLITRDDLSLSEIKEASSDEDIRNLIDALVSKTLRLEHLILEEDIANASREYVRYAKYLVQLSQGKPVAMTAAEWMSHRIYSTDTLVSVLAMNVTKLGDNRRLLRAMRQVTGESALGRANLGYLCRHDGDHSTSNEECLYHALGQYDATAMMSYAPEWTVGWLDALGPEARVVALAVLDSGTAGASMSSVTEAAMAITNV
jgi:hypothetical protein